MLNRRRIASVLLILLALYGGSYLVLSRQGFEESRRSNLRGFYFFPPRDTDAWRFCNYACVGAYYPLIKIDCAIGTGMEPAGEPFWGLSK